MLSLVLLAVPGCGKGPDGPKLLSITGKLTLAGQPLKAVNVQLLPVEAGKLSAAGLTDDKGIFNPVASDGRRGVALGKYKVVLMQTTAVKDMSDYYAKGPQAGGSTPSAPWPAEYGDVSTTPKQVDVAADTKSIDIAI
jgi:hypothetical protein